MVARLILDQNKLIASKPGVDVLTASPGDLIFDSRSQKYLSAYVSGAFSTSLFVFDAAGSAAGPFGGNEVYKYTLTYGKTFSAPPKVFLAFRTGLYDSTTLNAMDSWTLSSITLVFDAAIGGNYSIGDQIVITAVGFQNRVVFEARRTYGRDVYYYQPVPSFVYYLVATSA